MAGLCIFFLVLTASLRTALGSTNGCSNGQCTSPGMINVAASLAQTHKNVRHHTLHALDTVANIGGADQESLSGMNEVVVALAEKVAGHNYSMTASEKQAMDVIENFIKLLFNTSKTQFDEDQGEVNRARDAIQGCTTDANKTMPTVVGLKSTMESAREAHNKCRTAEGQNKDNMTQACKQYETYRTSDSKRVPPVCMETKFTLAHIGAADESQDLQQMESCLQETKEWIDPLYQKYIQCKNNTDQNTEHKANCSAKQDHFEQDFCAYASKLEDVCNAQTSCRARTVGARNMTHAAVNVAEKARKADVQTAHRILCLFKVFEANNTHKTSTLQACLNQSVSTSAYDVTYHSIPDPVACEKQADEPCQASWKLREYEQQAWFSKIDSMAACKPCPIPQTTTTTTTAATATAAAVKYQYFKWTIVQTGTKNHICVEGMKLSAAGKDYFPFAVQRNGFSNQYADPSVNWRSNHYGHWCGWSTDGDGANLVLDMGESVAPESYSFKLHTNVCRNDPRRWTWEGSSDGQSWNSLGPVVAVDCNLLNHKGGHDPLGWNTFDFQAQAPTTSTTTTTTVSATSPKEPTVGHPIPVTLPSKTSGSTDVSIDGSGNVYLGFNGNTVSYIVKLDTAGKQQWAKDVAHVALSAIAADDQGNSFMCGMVHPPHALAGQTNVGNDDWGVIKLDTNGQVVWTAQIGSTGSERPSGIALDHSGNILQTGYVDGAKFPGNYGGRDGVVAKYDPQGKKLWVQNVGTQHWDYMTGVAADASGNVFSVGVTLNPKGKTATIAKFAPDGQKLFFKENSVSKEGQSFKHVCTDAAGFAYATGFVFPTDASFWQTLVMKFDPDGNPVWTKTFGAPQGNFNTYGFKICCATSGAVMVGGNSKGAMNDYFVIGLDSATGDKLWFKEWGTSGNNRFKGLDSKNGRTVMTGNPGAYVVMLE